MTIPAPPADRPLGVVLMGSAARRRRERLVRLLFLSAALVSVVISALIVVSLIGGAADFVSKIAPAQLLEDGWYPRRDEFGLLTLLAGSLLVTGIALLLAVPIGLMSAIFLAEYAGTRTRRIVKPVLEILAGIPSVVLGFFAL
ncbi:MAG: hypothetical protein WEF51_02735, partial [Chloroflexota bacterium]